MLYQFDFLSYWSFTPKSVSVLLQFYESLFKHYACFYQALDVGAGETVEF